MITTIILFIVLMLAVISDLRYQRIPNWLTLSTFILAVMYHAVSHGLSGLLFALEGGVIGILVLMLPYLMGGMGAGDAKLMGAVGALLGPQGVFLAFILTALIGGGYAVAILAFYGNLGRTLQRYWLVLRTFFMTGKLTYMPPSEEEAKPRLRYGVAIALGTILSVAMKNSIYEMLHLD